MMKTWPSFLFTFATLGCLLLLSPNYTTAQEMTEAQRRERCENNRRYLEDYNRQLEAIEAKLNLTMGDEDLAQARANYNFAENILQKGYNERSKATREEQIAKIEELSTLHEFDEQKYCPQGLKTYNSDCLSQLVEKIRLRVQAAEDTNPQRNQLNDQKAQLETKRNLHQSRLRELGCDSSESQPSGCQGFAGSWKTSFGTMTFTRRGNQIVSNYDFDGGNIRGTLSADGRTLTGTYTEIKAKGSFRFSLSQDGKRFTGNWNRTSGTREPPNGEWSGECVSP